MRRYAAARVKVSWQTEILVISYHGSCWYMRVVQRMRNASPKRRRSYAPIDAHRDVPFGHRRLEPGGLPNAFVDAGGGWIRTLAPRILRPGDFWTVQSPVALHTGALDLLVHDPTRLERVHGTS